MEEQRNEIHLKMYRKTFGTFREMAFNLSHIEGIGDHSAIVGSFTSFLLQTQTMTFVRNNQFYFNGYEVIIISDKGTMPRSVNAGCSLQKFMHEEGFDKGWEEIDEDSDKYIKIKDSLLS